MSARRILSAISGGAARRPRAVLSLALVLCLAGAALALSLHPTAATSSFVSPSSGSYRATQTFYKNFGEEPIEVLVKGNLRQLVLSDDIERLIGLEGCLSGNVPAKALAAEGGASGPCGQLAKAQTVKVVFGPGTFINESAEEITHQLASEKAEAEAQARSAKRNVYRAALARHLSIAQATSLGEEASKVTLQRFAEELTKLALQYGLTSQPSLNDANFVERLVFDPSARAGTPKERFAYLFPNRESALVSVRLKAGLSEGQRTHTIEEIRKAAQMPQWHLTHGESYLLTGEPVIVSDLTSSITHSLELLLLAVLLVMAITLALIFRGRPRLLPLAIAALAAALTFGALSAVGASLTVASVAVLPVLIGLAVDYAIQFQSRVQEASEQNGGDQREAVHHAALTGAPVIATAGIASAAALAVLGLSPVPMVRGFGLLLIAGIAIAMLCALIVGSAALALVGREAHASNRSPLSALADPIESRIGAAWRGAREVLMDNALNRFVSRTALSMAERNPRRMLIGGFIAALIGWGLGTQTAVQTDISKLVPQNTSSLQNLNELERVSGVGGEIDLMVSAKDLTKPAVISWMGSYENTVLEHFRYSSTRGCGHAQICPAFSLPDLFQATTGNGSSNGSQGTSGANSQSAVKHTPTQPEIRELLNVIPSYFSQDVITPDRRVATLAFGIKLMSLSEQQHVIDQMRSSLHPPKGISAQLVGLPVLAAQSGTEVASNSRRMITLLAGLLAVALVLLIAFRGDMRRALVPMAPIVFATGWSALVLFLIRVPLNPMSVTLGALVTAISTEFSVLIAERHRQERLAGHDVTEALARSYRRTGAAVAASGVTAIAGFGVLVLSDIAMLRDFGLVTLVDLSVSLIGVLLVLPSALVLAERGQLERPPDGLGGRFAWRGLPPARLRLRGRARHESI
jgi:uncharacterized protein